MRTLIATLLFTATAFAQEKPKELLAAALKVSGECFYERDGKTMPAKPKTIFFRSDRLFTKKGKMDVQIGPVAVLHLAPYSTIRLSDLTEQDRKSNIVVDLESGQGYTKFAKKMGPGSKYTIRSPTLVAGIRGTEFILSAGDSSGESHEDSDIPQGVFVNTGVVAVSPINREDDIIELQPGEQVTGVDNALVKGVMEDFIKKKMKLFKQLNAMKEEQYRILEREKNRQIELLEKVKGSVNIDQLKEKNKQLFNKR
jgi:hypothetical protein